MISQKSSQEVVGGKRKRERVGWAPTSYNFKEPPNGEIKHI